MIDATVARHGILTVIAGLSSKVGTSAVKPPKIRKHGTMTKRDVRLKTTCESLCLQS